MTPSRIATALFAALMSAGTMATAQAHNLGDSGVHSHFAESQNLAALLADHGWLVLAVATSLMGAGLVLRRWKRS